MPRFAIVSIRYDATCMYDRAPGQNAGGDGGIGGQGVQHISLHNLHLDQVHGSSVHL